MTRKDLLVNVATALGLLAVAGGLALIWLPLGVIAAGLALLAVGWLAR